MSKNPNQQSIISNQQLETKPPLVRVKLDLSFLKTKYIVLFLAIATGTMGAIIAIYAYNKVGYINNLSVPIVAESERLNSKDIKNLTEKISQIAVIPEDETPTVLTVSDLTKLHSNPFFNNAKLKDKILIFKKAERIILYDPLGHKIVNMGPYSDNTELPNPMPGAQYESTQPSPAESSPSSE